MVQCCSGLPQSERVFSFILSGQEIKPGATVEYQEGVIVRYHVSHLFQNTELHVLPCCPEQLHRMFVCPILKLDSVDLHKPHDTKSATQWF